MKKLLGIGVVLLFLIAFFVHKQAPKEETVQPVTFVLQPTHSPLDSLPKKAIFVPYWTFVNSLQVNEYDEVIYFGIGVDENGINTRDEGFRKLSRFVDLAKSNQAKTLAVRMTDSQINSKVLEDVVLQKKIIDTSIDLAKEHNMDGVLLDFEIAALSFESVVKKISVFYQSFYKAVQKEGKVFSVALYGDTFYRARPYDIQTIAKNSDEMFLMAYDFHKARENPGPNFPLYGKETYGYDLSSMLVDFRKQASQARLTVVFGLFGYDWSVDDKGQSIGTGVPISYNSIKQKFLDSCEFDNCQVRRDENSSETEVRYTDTQGKKHIVWFEDPVSVEKKRQFLTEQGIDSIAFWAYSYF